MRTSFWEMVVVVVSLLCLLVELLGFTVGIDPFPSVSDYETFEVTLLYSYYGLMIARFIAMVTLVQFGSRVVTLESKGEDPRKHYSAVKVIYRRGLGMKKKEQLTVFDIV